MIHLMGVKLPQGQAIIPTETIAGAVSDLKNPKNTIVYSEAFPDGITVAIPISDFYDLWLACLLSDYEEITTEQVTSH